MSRLILYVSVATIAFIVGVAANWSINTLGDLAVDQIYGEVTDLIAVVKEAGADPEGLFADRYNGQP